MQCNRLSQGCLQQTLGEAIYSEACEIVANRYRVELLRTMADLAEAKEQDERIFLEAVEDADAGGKAI